MPTQTKIPHNLPTGPGPQIARVKRHPSDIVAMIGLLVVGVIIIWGLIHIARLSSPWFASLFPKTAPRVEIPAPKVATPVVVAKPTPTPTKPVPVQTGPAHSINSGQADLSVRIISASIDGYGNGVVTFDISNIGGSPTGVWYFAAQLPTEFGYTYNSPAQISLAPGDHIANTLNFSSPFAGGYGGTQQGVGGFVSIHVDPTNSIREMTENNNYARQSVGVNGYYQQPYMY